RALPDSCLTKNKLPGKDKFKALYPDIDWPIQLEYGEKIGLGSRKYKLEKL
ncbi:MAG: 4Fe-4S ferredoxin, partial [Deltaproteobacteria bacterium]|nr:4Fe-4S ferredoxin [Deltaproteobacteria bacterium]